MKKKTATKAARFITQLMQVGIEKLTDDIFESKRPGLDFEALSAEDAEKVFYVGDTLFRYARNGTGYNVIIYADTILLVVIDGASGVVSSVEVDTTLIH